MKYYERITRQSERVKGHKLPGLHIQVCDLATGLVLGETGWIDNSKIGASRIAQLENTHNPKFEIQTHIDYRNENHQIGTLMLRLVIDSLKNYPGSHFQTLQIHECTTDSVGFYSKAFKTLQTQGVVISHCITSMDPSGYNYELQIR